MFELKELESTYQKTRKRLGRGEGSGTGTTAGRGQKGQKSRRNIPARFEGGQMPLIQRLAKRGFTSRTPNTSQILQLAAVNEAFESGAKIDAAALDAKWPLDKGREFHKIVGPVALEKPFHFEGVSMSKGVKEAVYAASGTVE